MNIRSSGINSMERYQNVSRARFLCSKWVMRTRRRRTYPDAVESAVHSRRKEFGGGKEGRGRKRRITGWHGDGGGESPGRLPLDHRGKLATSAESRPRRRRCSGVDAPQPLLLPSFLPSFLSASYLGETTPLSRPFLLGISLGRRGRGWKG